MLIGGCVYARWLNAGGSEMAAIAILATSSMIAFGAIIMGMLFYAIRYLISTILKKQTYEIPFWYGTIQQGFFIWCIFFLFLLVDYFELFPS